MSAPPFLVFTDLDGTLLDHEDYGWSAALPALSKLRALGVPVVLASSKTAAEIATLRDEMRLSKYPAIVENGAGLLPPGKADAAGEAGMYQRLRKALDDVPPELRRHFEGFGDWDDEEVARRTGLSPTAAAAARKRAFSEPGTWTGSPEERTAFLAALAEAGVTARRGGRFLTLSFGGSKAERMAEVLADFADDEGNSPVSVALGDAPNDVEMLNSADFGVIIANPEGAEVPVLAGERAGRIRRSTQPGAAGWNEMMTTLISELSGRGTGS